MTANLTGILGTFDVRVDLLKAADALGNPAALLAAFDVPGQVHARRGSFLATVPTSS